jgi:hypothetical protein
MKGTRYTALNHARKANLLRDRWINVHSPTRPIEPHIAVNQSKNCVIATQAHIFAGQKLRAALTKDNISGDNHFAAEFFDAQPLADTIATVLDAALSFFVSHFLFLRFFRGSLLCASADRFNFNAGEFATVPDRAVIAFAPPIFKRDDFFVFALLDNFGRDLSTRAVTDLVAIDMHQHFERRSLARLNVEKIDIDGFAFRDTILPAASLDNCVSHKRFPGRKSRANSHRWTTLTSEIIAKSYIRFSPSPGASRPPLPQGED